MEKNAIAVPRIAGLVWPILLSVCLVLVACGGSSRDGSDEWGDTTRLKAGDCVGGFPARPPERVACDSSGVTFRVLDAWPLTEENKDRTCPVGTNMLFAPPTEPDPTRLCLQSVAP